MSFSAGYTLLLVVIIALVVSFGILRIVDKKLSKITLNLPKIKIPPQEVILKVDHQDKYQVKAQRVVNGKKTKVTVKPYEGDAPEEKIGKIETMQNITPPKKGKKKNKKISQSKIKYNKQYHGSNPYQQLYEKFDVLHQLPQLL